MARQPSNLQTLLPSLWRLTRRFGPHLRKQWRLLIIAVPALFAEVVFRLLEPWPLKFVFDRVISPTASGSPGRFPALDTLEPIHLIVGAMLAIVAIAGLRALAAYWNKIGFALVGNRVLTDVRHELYHHLQGLSLSFHHQARSGDLIVRVIDDIGRLKEATVTAVLPLLASVLIWLGMVVFMFWLDWRLALIALAPLPFFAFRTQTLTRRIHTVSRQQRQRQSAMAATAAEAMGAIKTVQALSLESAFAEAFTSQSRKSLSEGVQAKRLAVTLERSVDVLMAIARALAVGYGAYLVMAKALTPGELLVFLAYLRKAYKPIQDFAKYTGRLAKAAAAGERVADLLDREPDVRDLPGAVVAPLFCGAVQFHRVRFGYEPGQQVLDDINFEAKPGQRIALVGPSGSGKSTLISLLLRLYDPDAGSMRIDGQDIRHYTLASLRGQISVVLQESLLFAASVRDNIAYGNPEATPEAIEAAAHLANAHAFITELPQGYDTVLGERGVTLSGGQRQRLAIARAAIRQAPILILDEPTLGLDEENERTVIAALNCLSHACTTFLVTHDLALAASADVILYIEGGSIRERGTHAELIQHSGAYATLYRLQCTPDRQLEEVSHAITP
ncbi:ABC transporter ATP-binding protein [Candidatus Entotheonella palauensis]|uniref:ABC transporter ATP-binding protein n=1 Tax=Candidatus Entotheonella palauensis TaxID=93172 RepID=UPI000B7E7258|nr:ABC transporter ATP-binding protein [Candidatus Entotheonella palauensis]